MVSAIFLIILVIFPCLAAGESANSGFCRSLDNDKFQAVYLSRMIEPDSKIKTVRDLVAHLRIRHRIPISFVEAKPEEPMKLKRKAMTLDNLLAETARQYSDYRCEIRGGRLIFRDGDTLFDAVISDVQLADVYRFAALNRYIVHLKTYEQFAEWQGSWVGGNLDSPLVDEKVILSPRAPLLDHLVQLLGQLKTAYFTIPAPGELPRRIEISEVQ